MLSIIVPVYKAEDYIHRCINSILSQSYSDFELLLVDDGSPDNSGVICDDYAASDSRVHVYHKENGGVSSARNLGLDNACGEWITFVDSDDWIDSDYAKIMLTNFDADIIKCGIKCTTGVLWHSENTYISCSDFIKKYSTHPLIRTSCGTLYRSDIIKDKALKFDTSVRFGEDMMFNLQYLVYCKTVRLNDMLGYSYWSEPGLFPSSKYKLSLEEIKVALEKTIELKICLGLQKKIDISTDFDFTMYLSMIPLNYMTDKRCLEDYFLLCKHFTPTLTKDSFYNSEIYSPLIRGIYELKKSYESKSYSKAKELYCVLAVLSSEVNYTPKFKIKDSYLWYWLIKQDLHCCLDLLLRLYFFMKRVWRSIY